MCSCIYDRCVFVSRRYIAELSGVCLCLLSRLRQCYCFMWVATGDQNRPYHMMPYLALWCTSFFERNGNSQAAGHNISSNCSFFYSATTTMHDDCRFHVSQAKVEVSSWCILATLLEILLIA